MYNCLIFAQLHIYRNDIMISLTKSEIAIMEERLWYVKSIVKGIASKSNHSNTIFCCIIFCSIQICMSDYGKSCGVLTNGSDKINLTNDCCPNCTQEGPGKSLF